MTTPAGPERFEPSQPPDAMSAPVPQQVPMTEPVDPARRRRWSGRRTAVAAALVLGLTTAGALAAAAALPAGQGSVGDRDRFGPGGQFGQGGQLGPGGQGGFGQTGRDGRPHGGFSGQGPSGSGIDPSQQQGGTGVPGQQGGTGFDPSQIPGQAT